MEYDSLKKKDVSIYARTLVILINITLNENYQTQKDTYKWIYLYDILEKKTM